MRQRGDLLCRCPQPRDLVGVPAPGEAPKQKRSARDDRRTAQQGRPPRERRRERPDQQHHRQGDPRADRVEEQRADHRPHPQVAGLGSQVVHTLEGFGLVALVAGQLVQRLEVSFAHLPAWSTGERPGVADLFEQHAEVNPHEAERRAARQAVQPPQIVSEGVAVLVVGVYARHPRDAVLDEHGGGGLLHERWSVRSHGVQQVAQRTEGVVLVPVLDVHNPGRLEEPVAKLDPGPKGRGRHPRYLLSSEVGLQQALGQILLHLGPVQLRIVVAPEKDHRVPRADEVRQVGHHRAMALQDAVQLPAGLGAGVVQANATLVGFDVEPITLHGPVGIRSERDGEEVEHVPGEDESPRQPVGPLALIVLQETAELAIFHHRRLQIADAAAVLGRLAQVHVGHHEQVVGALGPDRRAPGGGGRGRGLRARKQGTQPAPGPSASAPRAVAAAFRRLVHATLLVVCGWRTQRS